ncbi:MAG: hypothetical protein JNJ70_24250 [Verrucomicrobiales bacterium]|nr:hypothetical protein [Verrucomicrobiales bacterium]
MLPPGCGRRIVALRMGDALKALLGKGLAASGKSRGEVIDLLGRTNRSKAFRRLDELLSGNPSETTFLREVAEVLGIPLNQIEVALEFDRESDSREHAERIEQANREWFDRTGPHLWVILPKGYCPSLITVLGPDYFLLVPVPPAVIALPDFEQLQEVGGIARAHFADPKRRVREVAGYRFRRSLDETFEFSTEGDCLGRMEGPPPVRVVSSSFRGGLHRLRRVIAREDGGR